MNRYTLMCAAVCAALSMASCKSSESAYKKAYEKAKAQEAQTVQPAEQTQANVVAPVETAPATEARVVDNADDVPVRQESFSLVKGDGLKAYSVVVGSFSVQANAEGLREQLIGKGYAAQVVKNTDRNMFRVAATTFDSKAEAVASRNQLRQDYPDAWLLAK